MPAPLPRAYPRRPYLPWPRPRRPGWLGLLAACAVAGSTGATLPRRPVDNAGVVGLVLNGVTATLVAPLGPTARPYTPDCMALIDPGFTGRCLTVSASGGTVAGEVEELTTGQTQAEPKAGRQERDLVWRRQGDHWSLDLRRVFQTSGLTTQVYSSRRVSGGAPVLVFVTPSAAAGFGHELDVVGANGQVLLNRFMGQGFGVVPTEGGMVTYVPGWSEKEGPAGAYDQTLIRLVDGLWTVVAEQYVPDQAALAQHHGVFSYQPA